MGFKRIEAILKQPWFRGGLIGAVCASLLVSVYYSKDRWSALTAIGTISAVVVALYLSVNAKREERRKRSVEAMIYIWSVYRPITKIRDFIADATHKNADGSLNGEQFLSRVEAYRDVISDYDFPRLYDFDPDLCININQLRNGMENLLENFHHPLQTAQGRQYALSKNYEVAHNSCELIRKHDASAYLGRD